MSYLIYRLKWKLAPYINWGSPVHVDIELCSTCNLSCRICHRKNKTWTDGYMSLKSFKKLIDEAVEMGVKSVKLNWRGESLLHPDFNKMVDYTAGKFTEVMINTNLQSDNISHVFKLADIDNVKISVDSLFEEYEAMRQGANWHKLICNLEMLHLFKKDFTIQRRTINNMKYSDEEFVKYFKRFDVKINSLPAFQRNDNEIFKTHNMKRKYCGQPSRRLVVTWDGKVYPCCVSYEQPKGMYLGRGLKSAWNNPKRLKIIKSSRVGCEDCNKCTSREAWK